MPERHSGTEARDLKTALSAPVAAVLPVKRPAKKPGSSVRGVRKLPSGAMIDRFVISSNGDKVVQLLGTAPWTLLITRPPFETLKPSDDPEPTAPRHAPSRTGVRFIALAVQRLVPVSQNEPMVVRERKVPVARREDVKRPVKR